MSGPRFSSSIIDRREPRMVRGKAIVRDRRMMRRPKPKLFAAAPDRSAAANTINGKECCCGTPPPCTDPCTAFNCEYCPNDELTLLVSVYTHETWGPSAGGPTRPPCDHFRNACPGKPGPCESLDVAQSYEGGVGFTGKSIITHTLETPSRRHTGPCGSFGSLDLPPAMMRREQFSGALSSIFQGCVVVAPPRDETALIPFEFRRSDGGWVLTTTSDVQFSFSLGCRNEPPSCNDRDCDAGRVISDMICALLPLDCHADEIFVDSGCVQRRSIFEPECRWAHDTFHLIYDIERRP